MKLNHPSKPNLLLVMIAAGLLFSVRAQADTNDKLDVNLNTIYLGTKSQKNGQVLNEDIIQIPLPLSEHARNTGQGPFGGITYFDIKTLSNNLAGGSALANSQTQVASVTGIGRIYYSAMVPGDSPHTFVPFITLFRALTVDYRDNLQSYSASTSTWFSPAFMYAYRTNEKVAWHLDMELYSRSMTGNNRSRFGISYMPSWPWIVSASFERTAWDLGLPVGGGIATLKGYTNSGYLKVILRDPPQGNFALIIGIDSTHNINGPLQDAPYSTTGRFFGIEASGGVLAW